VIAVSACSDTGSAFNFVSPAFGNLWYLTYTVSPIAHTPFVTKDTVLKDLATLRSTVNGLPNSAFYPTGIKPAVLAMIDGATLQAKYDRYGDAANTLRSKFIPRVDGCTLRGSADATDLVKCPYQIALYEQATNIAQELQSLQANPS
jgi:hypothetical protein